MKKLFLLASGVLIFSSVLLANSKIPKLEEQVARNPNNAKAVFNLTKEYCRADSVVKAVESFKRLAALDSNLASDVFVRAKVAIYLGLEPFFPQLITDSVCEAPRFSQDEKKILFQRNTGWDYNAGIMDAFSGKGFKMLTKSDSGCYGPCFAGSYDQILYSRRADDQQGTTKLIYNDLTGGGEKVIFTNPGVMETIDWAGEDKPVLFSYYSIDTKTWEIGLYDAESGELKQLTNNYYTDRYPRYSSDGKYIVYTDDRLIDFDIRIMDTKGKVVENLDIGPGRDVLPVFGDHDRKVAFCSDRNGGNQFDIFVYDRRTKDVIPVTYHQSHDLFPDFSNDGSWLIFTSNREQDEMVHPYFVSLNQPISVERLLEEINKEEPQDGGSNDNQSP